MASESFQPEACDVCGRHLLPGESAREYVTADRDRRAVCDLCRGSAERAGWVRADRVRDEEPSADPDRRPRRRWIVERISQRRARRREESEEAEQPEEDEERPTPQPKPSAPAKEVPRRPGGAEPPERRIRRALERFNRSEHRRTVEGLTRSLGSPRVAAVTPAEAPEQVRLTVAWELSWYQWKVESGGDGDAAVRALRNGKEVSELGPADRAWNARAGEDGRIQLRVGSNGDGDVLVPDDPG